MKFKKKDKKINEIGWFQNVGSQDAIDAFNKGNKLACDVNTNVDTTADGTVGAVSEQYKFENRRNDK